MGREIILPRKPVQLVEDFSSQFTRQGRQNYEQRHSNAVSYFAPILAVAEGLDPLIMIATGRLHDIGYAGLDGDAKSYEDLQANKEAHMIRGAELAEKFFQLPGVAGYYTDEQIARIIHLVLVHDNVSQLNEPYEKVFMEADTLGAIDLSRVPPMNYWAGMEYIEKSLYGKRVPKFETSLGRKILGELLPRYVSFIESQKGRPKIFLSRV